MVNILSIDEMVKKYPEGEEYLAIKETFKAVRKHYPGILGFSLVRQARDEDIQNLSGLMSQLLKWEPVSGLEPTQEKERELVFWKRTQLYVDIAEYLCQFRNSGLIRYYVPPSV